MMHAAGNAMETGEQYPITLVTAWYKIRRRGESSFRPYEEWMRNLLSYIRWPLVVFGEEQSLDEMRRMRGDKPAVYLAVNPEEFIVRKYWSVSRISARIVRTSPAPWTPISPWSGMRSATLPAVPLQ